ncbi:MAG TPA: hypothetical protein VM223_04990 [Planctomycetota bacterium]|nr:hypothetical protein [Planctomycetota bacterium]
MADTIKTKIEESAEAGIRRASGDSGSVEQHSIPDLIAADKHIEGRKASRKAGLGIKILKLVSPGA